MLQTLNNRSLTSVRDDSLASFRTDTNYQHFTLIHLSKPPKFSAGGTF
jgi:hypothetical protein